MFVAKIKLPAPFRHWNPQKYVSMLIMTISGWLERGIPRKNNPKHRLSISPAVQTTVLYGSLIVWMLARIYLDHGPLLSKTPGWLAATLAITAIVYAAVALVDADRVAKIKRIGFTDTDLQSQASMTVGRWFQSATILLVIVFGGLALSFQFKGSPMPTWLSIGYPAAAVFHIAVTIQSEYIFRRFAEVNAQIEEWEQKSASYQMPD